MWAYTSLVMRYGGALRAVCTKYVQQLPELDSTALLPLSTTCVLQMYELCVASPSFSVHVCVVVPLFWNDDHRALNEQTEADA